MARGPCTCSHIALPEFSNPSLEASSKIQVAILRDQSKDIVKSFVGMNRNFLPAVQQLNQDAGQFFRLL